MYVRRPPDERLSDIVADLFEGVMIGADRVGGQTVTRPSPNTLIISRKRTGHLVVLACLTLFPIGLLALLTRRTETLTIRVDERHDGFEVSALGEGDPAIMGALERFLAELVGRARRAEPGIAALAFGEQSRAREHHPLVGTREALSLPGLKAASG
jgi:hypothetical protein